MLKKRDAYEEKNGKLYENWNNRSAGGGAGAGRGAKPERDTSKLQKDKDGKVLPTGQVGCNYLAQGKECPKGKPDCPFSHEDKDVKARKKWLAKLEKGSAPAPKAEAKAKPKVKPKKKEKEAIDPAGPAADDEEESEDQEKEAEEDDGEESSSAPSEEVDSE